VNSEDRTSGLAGAAEGSAPFGGSVEVAAGGLHERFFRLVAVSAVSLSTKAVECRQRAIWGDFKNSASAVGPSKLSRSIEVLVSSLNQGRCWTSTVSAVRLGAKAIERGQSTLLANFVDRALPC